MKKRTNLLTILVLQNLISGKIFAKFKAVLPIKWAMLPLCAFWWHILELSVTFLAFFFAVFGSFGPFTPFCRNLDLSEFVHFSGLIVFFWFKPCCDTWLVAYDMWHMTHDTWYVTSGMWHVLWGEHSLKISAPYLLRFGMDRIWKVLNKRMTKWTN